LTSAAVAVCVVGRCAALRLHDVVAGDLFADDARLLRFRRSSDADGRVPEMTDTLNATERLYRVVLRTRPGGALYEATVRQPLSAEQLAGSERERGAVRRQRGAARSSIEKRGAACRQRGAARSSTEKRGAARRSLPTAWSSEDQLGAA